MGICFIVREPREYCNNACYANNLMEVVRGLVFYIVHLDVSIWFSDYTYYNYTRRSKPHYPRVRVNSTSDREQRL